jgi:hypothetical protein
MEDKMSLVAEFEEKYKEQVVHPLYNDDDDDDDDDDDPLNNNNNNNDDDDSDPLNNDDDDDDPLKNEEHKEQVTHPLSNDVMDTSIRGIHSTGLMP